MGEYAREVVLHEISCYNSAMTTRKTNITLKLDAGLLRRVKVLAAQKGTSVSAMLTTQLEEVLTKTKDDAYEEAMKRAIELMKQSTGYGWQKPNSREELHER